VSATPPPGFPLAQIELSVQGSFFQRKVLICFSKLPHFTYIFRKQFQIQVGHATGGCVTTPPAMLLAQIELSVQVSFFNDFFLFFYSSHLTCIFRK
jgi:hypothetical protein